MITTMITTIEMNEEDYIKMREELLTQYRLKKSFRVAIGKNGLIPSKWINFKTFNPDYNLREILNDEIVIEFDNKDEKPFKEFQIFAYQLTNLTALNLLKDGFAFQIWKHEGKSPHLHIHNLPISHLDPDKRKQFKEFFIKKYVPKKYHYWIDDSLTGVHLIALEWAIHWKGCYDRKVLIIKNEG